MICAHHGRISGWTLSRLGVRRASEWKDLRTGGLVTRSSPPAVRLSARNERHKLRCAMGSIPPGEGETRIARTALGWVEMATVKLNESLMQRLSAFRIIGGGRAAFLSRHTPDPV
jgi:hypothetical protein